MPFTVLPILDKMVEFYQKPISTERFQAYLQLLQGNTKGDMVLPIGGYNPMAKPHLLDKLAELKALKAEEIMSDVLATINQKTTVPKTDQQFQVSITIADDLLGGWTNRFTTDYDSRFKLNPLITRHFCVALFWSSEAYTVDLIQQRVQETVFRTLYWLEHPRPLTLAAHVAQELFVVKNTQFASSPLAVDMTFLENFYQEHQTTDDYSVIFSFLYGDNAALQLGFKEYGVQGEMAGFNYIRRLV
jgi:hypothetical protein